MVHRGRAVKYLLVSLMLLAGCAPVSGDAGRTGGENPPVVAKKRIVASYPRSDVDAMSALITGAAGRAVAPFVHGGLGMLGERGDLHAELAEAVPTLENGLWKLFDDGRMETTWKLKPNARWHDGVQLTTADLLFGSQVEQDKELTVTSSSRGGYDTGQVAGIVASDALTVTIQWRNPFIDAALMFGSSDRLLPKHVLEQPFSEDKTKLLNHPFFTDEFIGAGPFKLKRYERGSHALFEAFDGYVLGRAKLDEVEIRFISDVNTLVANILAGVVDTTLVASQSLSPDQAAELRRQWSDGEVVVSPILVSAAVIAPQMLEPSIPIVLNVQFRRALYQAISPQELVEEIMHGQGGIPESIVARHLPEHQGIQDAIVRYQYDPRRSVEMLEQLGYTKGRDGIFQDASGQKLAFDVMSHAQNTNRPALVVADYWNRLGLDVKPFIVPEQQQGDAKLTNTFSAFKIRTPSMKNYDDMQAYLHSSRIARPENNFRGGGNSARYANPDLDAALDSLTKTMVLAPRIRAIREVVRIQTDQAVWNGLYYLTYETPINRRLINRTPDNSLVAWGSFTYLWDVTQ